MSTIYEYPGAADAETYEYENLTADPDCLIEAEMERLAPISGAVMLDVGAGSGFHTARFAEQASHVYAVEPDPNMLRQFHARFTDGSHQNVSLLEANAEQIPLPDESIDIAHARFAYFFGTDDCAPGIAEVKRLLKPGGHFFIIDNYHGRGQFSQFLEMAYGSNAELQQKDEQFYNVRGFGLKVVDSCWRDQSRDILRRIISMEFPENCVDRIMQQIDGIELSYAYAVYHYRKP